MFQSYFTVVAALECGSHAPACSASMACALQNVNQNAHNLKHALDHWLQVKVLVGLSSRICTSRLAEYTRRMSEKLQPKQGRGRRVPALQAAQTADPNIKPK